MPARRIGQTATFFPGIRSAIVLSSGVSTSTSSTPISLVASGVRIGTPAATMRGFDEDDFSEVASIIVGALADDADVAALAARSSALCDRRPLYPGFRGSTTYLA